MVHCLITDKENTFFVVIVQIYFLLIIITKTPNLIGGQVVHFYLTTYKQIVSGLRRCIFRAQVHSIGICCMRVPSRGRSIALERGMVFGYDRCRGHSYCTPPRVSYHSYPACDAKLILVTYDSMNRLGQS